MATPKRQGGIGWALMAGGGKNHIHPGWYRIGGQPLFVNIDKVHLRTRLRQNSVQAGIAGVFQCAHTPRPQQHLGR